MRQRNEIKMQKETNFDCYFFFLLLLDPLFDKQNKNMTFDKKATRSLALKKSRQKVIIKKICVAFSA